MRRRCAAPPSVLDDLEDVALLFLAGLLVTPLIAIVPSFATAPALIVVGIYMFRNIREINFKDMEIAIPAFLTMILMPLTYSISMGLCFGFISYVIVAIVGGKIKEIHLLMWVISLLSVIELVLNVM